VPRYPFFTIITEKTGLEFSIEIELLAYEELAAEEVAVALIFDQLSLCNGTDINAIWIFIKVLLPRVEASRHFMRQGFISLSPNKCSEVEERQ